MIETFVTDELIVRPIKESDTKFAFDHWTQEIDIARYMTWKPHRSIEETKRFVSSCLDGWKNEDYTWIIEIRSTGEIIGSFSARKKGHAIDLGYLLVQKHWGKAYMPSVIKAFANEAFKMDGIYRLWAVCDIDNVASKRCMEKAGMKNEGILRAWLVHPNVGNEPRDCYCLSLLKNEI